MIVFPKVLEQRSKSLSFVLEKWKDTGLSHNHSPTIVSQMSAVDQPNTSCSSSAQVSAMELTPPKLNSPTSDNAANMIASMTPSVGQVTGPPLSVPASTENVNEILKNERPSLVTAMSEPSFTHAQIIDSQSNNNNNNTNQRNGNSSTSPRPMKEINRIALVGGDIILEEEEEDEEEEEMQAVQAPKTENHTPHMAPLVAAPVPPRMTTEPPVSPKPVPVYVNASVLHQKKNPSYGQNINVTPDNKNSSKQLLAKQIL